MKLHQIITGLCVIGLTLPACVIEEEPQDDTRDTSPSNNSTTPSNNTQSTNNAQGTNNTMGTNNTNGTTPSEMCNDFTFTYAGAPEADRVYVTGAFIDWMEPGMGAIEMTKNAQDAWEVMTTVGTGAHHYKFVIERGGELEWIPDPTAEYAAPDGFGGLNGVLYSCVTPPTKCAQTFTFPNTDMDAERVLLTGEFLFWQETVEAGALELARQEDGSFTTMLPVQPGTWRYKYLLFREGAMMPEFISDPTNPRSEGDGFGGMNSVLEVTACQ